MTLNNSSTRQLVLATHNKHKTWEFQDLLVDSGIDILPLDGFPQVGEIEEDADSLEGNARKKAEAVFRMTSMPSMADDTGLEVYYLNGRPGVYSSRYAGPHCSYADNCKKLLHDLRGVPPRRRYARFRCVLCFVSSGNVRIVEEGFVPGVITENPRGTNGFGYDPIFLPLGSAKTLAEMSASEKNSLSHRGKAIQNIKSSLHSYFYQS